MLSFSISYPDLIEFPYFADLKEGIGGETEGDFTDNSLEDDYLAEVAEYTFCIG
jgi:hypothetical protein